MSKVIYRKTYGGAACDAKTHRVNLKSSINATKYKTNDWIPQLNRPSLLRKTSIKNWEGGFNTKVAIRGSLSNRAWFIRIEGVSSLKNRSAKNYKT